MIHSIIAFLLGAGFVGTPLGAYLHHRFGTTLASDWAKISGASPTVTPTPTIKK